MGEWLLAFSAAFCGTMAVFLVLFVASKLIDNWAAGPKSNEAIKRRMRRES